MLSKNKIKFLQSLSLKKNRDETGLFIIEGEKSIQEALKSSLVIKSIYGLKNHLEQFKTYNSDINVVSDDEIKKISTLKTPQGILAVCLKPTLSLHPVSLKNQLTLMLDNIQDPGNLGTIIRLCSWFGIVNIVCSQNTVDCFNPKVVQATMGAIAKTNIYYTNLASFLFECRNEDIPVYGTFVDGKNIYAESISKNGVIVMGNEGNGISREIEGMVTNKIAIPNYSIDRSGVESLNVSIATAIICAEFRRQFSE